MNDSNSDETEIGVTLKSTKNDGSTALLQLGDRLVAEGVPTDFEFFGQ